MDEYIKKEDIEQKIQDGLNNLVPGHDAIEILGMIYEIPAAEVAPVRHGRWVKHPTFNYKICSVCSGGTPCDIDGSEWLSRHCPSCGAKMYGELKEGAGEE